MCVLIVKRDCLIEMHSAFGDLPSKHEGAAHIIMPKHSRKRCNLLLSKFQSTGGYIATCIAVKGGNARDEDAVEHREKQQRVFGGLSGGPYLVDPLGRIESLRSGKDEDRVHWFRKYGSGIAQCILK